MHKIVPSLVMAAVSVALTGCMQSEQQDAKVTINKNPYPSTYQVLPSQKTLIQIHAGINEKNAFKRI